MSWTITLSGLDEDGSQEAVVRSQAATLVTGLRTAGVNLEAAVLYLGTEGVTEDLLAKYLGPVTAEPPPAASPDPVPEPAPPDNNPF